MHPFQAISIFGFGELARRFSQNSKQRREEEEEEKNGTSKCQSSLALETRNKQTGEMAERSGKNLLILNVNKTNALFCSSHIVSNC